MIKVYRPHLISIGLYALLALFFTWPLAARITTHIPGEATWAFDESTFIWNMWWLKFSVLTLKQTPLFSAYTFFPLGVDLTTYTFNLFNAAFSLPLQMTLSLPLANNLTLLFSYISSAYGAYLLVLYLLHKTIDPLSLGQAAPANQRPIYLAAFIAGTVYAFSASRMMYVALGHYNFVTIQWFPFYTLFLLKTLREDAIKNVVLAALFAALCLYAELTYSVFLLFLTLILFTGGVTGRPQRLTRLQKSKQLGRLAIMGGLTFIFTAPFTLAVLPDFLNPAFAEPGWGEGLKLSADLAGLVSLTPLHPLYDVEWVTELKRVVEGTSRFSDANTLFLGYGILILGLFGFWRYQKAGRVWLGSVFIFTILSLGPLLTINGRNRFDLDGIEVTFPLPFALLHYIPLINANRVPNRFGIPLTLSLAVLVGYAAVWLLAKHNVSQANLPPSRSATHMLPYFITLGLLIGLMFDQYSVPLSLTDARIPQVYHQIGAEDDDFTIMQLPLGWRNSYGTLGAERTQLQYYQAAHRRPILGGNTSRNPAFKFDYYRNIPLFQTLAEAQLYRGVDEITVERAKSQAAALMTLYSIKYLVIHDPIPRRAPYIDTFMPTRNLALDLIPHQPTPIYQSPGVQVFAVERPPVPDPHVIDFGEWSGAAYRGSGWAGDEVVFAATANWATTSEAVIFFPIQGAGDRHLALDIAPFYYPDAPAQGLTLLLNGHQLEGVHSLHEGWQVIEALLPENQLQPGLNRLRLHFAHTAQPRLVLPYNSLVGQTGLETPLDLEVNSGYDFAFATVGFAESAIDVSAHRRGINLAVIEPQEGQVLEVKGFDTAANEFEAVALSEFIAAIPQGNIVIVASQGAEAMAFFNADTLAALQSLGLETTNLNPPFSAIGVKGALPGSIAQALGSSETTAYLRLGAAPDTRNLAAAVDKVTIRK